MQRGSDKHSAWKDDALARDVEGMIAELPDADAIDQQMPIDDAEDRDDSPSELPLEVDPVDAVEQHSILGDDAEDYYPRG